MFQHLIFLPDHLQVAVLNKVKPFEFTLCLQTCKEIRAVVKNNRSKLKISLENYALSLDFDKHEAKLGREYLIHCQFRAKLPHAALCQLGHIVRKEEVLPLDKFIELLSDISLFQFSLVCISEELRTPQAKRAARKVLERMSELRMRTNELEMYNSDICMLAVEILKPTCVRNDYQDGVNLMDCLTKDCLKTLDFLDYFTDSLEDAKAVFTEVLPNVRYLDICLDFESNWIWELLLVTVKKILRGSAINERLSLSAFRTSLPDFPTYLAALPHKIYEQSFEESLLIVVFIQCDSKSSQLVFLTRYNTLGEGFDYKLVESLKDFQQFYCEVFKKEEYDLYDKIENEIFI